MADCGCNTGSPNSAFASGTCGDSTNPPLPGFVMPTDPCGCGPSTGGGSGDLSDFVRKTGPLQNISSVLNFITSPQVPNATQPNQAVNLSQISTLIASDGIISGLGLSISGSNVLVAAGSWRLAGTAYATTTVTTLSINAQDATLSRYDVVYADNTGVIHIVDGTLSATPVYPSIPDGTILVGAVSITPTSVTTIPIVGSFVTTNTNQTGLSGTKSWTAKHTFAAAPQFQNVPAAAATFLLSTDGSGNLTESTDIDITPYKLTADKGLFTGTDTITSNGYGLSVNKTININADGVGASLLDIGGTITNVGGHTGSYALALNVRSILSSVFAGNIYAPKFISNDFQINYDPTGLVNPAPWYMDFLDHTGALMGRFFDASKNLTLGSGVDYGSTLNVDGTLNVKSTITTALSIYQRVMVGASGVLVTQAEIVHQPVAYATTAALPANTYNNGTAGIGATLTANSNGALTVDGITSAVGDRVLVWKETSAPHNGIYTVTQTGSGSLPYILTRGSFSSIPQNLVAGMQVYAQSGTANAGNLFTQTTSGVIVIGTTSLNFVSNSTSSGNFVHITGVETITGNKVIDPTTGGAQPGLLFKNSSFIQMNDATSTFTQLRQVGPDEFWMISSTATNIAVLKGGQWYNRDSGGIETPYYISLNTQLIQWTNSGAYSLTSITRDGNEAITTASIIWPDGSTGTFTTDTASTAFPGAIDAFHVTYVPSVGSSHTVTQSLLTRDTAGAVTAQPVLTII